MTYSDGSATRYIMSRSGGLVQGARDSLNALISDLAGRADQGQRTRATILVTQDGAEVHDPKRDETKRYTGEADGLATDLRNGLNRSARKSIRLSFSGERAIIKHIRLPSTAAEVLPAILRNKVESLAPWPLEESLWGYQVANNAPQGEIAVDVGIVSRKTAFETMATLKAAGVRVQGMDIAPSAEGGKPIVLDFDADLRFSRTRSIIVSAVASVALCTVAVAAIGSYFAFINEQQNRDVRARIAEIQLALQGTGTPQTDAVLSASNEIYEEKRDAPPLVSVIEALTVAIPDNTWLESIDLRDGKLVITGRGSNASKVVENLEVSPAFSKVGFASAIQRDPEKGVDVFTVSAEQEKRGAKQ
jgi:general secretion pathway protein L